MRLYRRSPALLSLLHVLAVSLALAALSSPACMAKADRAKTPNRSTSQLVGTTGKVVYVKTTGSDASDGLSWATAKKTVKAGINVSVSGDEIWVAAGTYIERITLKAGTGLYGGFTGSETSRDQRNWKMNVTVLDGNQAGTVVGSPPGATSTTRIDGFTITNGGGESVGRGVSCVDSSPTITNNVIIGNNLTWGEATDGGGIYCRASSAIITNNEIIGNCASSNGAGIYCEALSSPTIANNIIAANSQHFPGTGSGGGGIHCDNSSPTITSNTIVGNHAPTYGGGIHCVSNASPTLSNNIVAFNSSGICGDTGATPILRNNCVYGNTAYDYSGLNSGMGDISADPLLADRSYRNFHVRPGSPCINAGWNGAPGLLATDIDGQPRTLGGAVDIGADEADGTVWLSGPYIIVRVSTSGDDANDGSSWAMAKRTIQAAMNAASKLGGEVWVKADVYTECTVLHPYAYVYGGFAGTETSRSERNWTANKTILDGGTMGSVVTVLGGGQTNSVDGFTIRNGKALRGGGVWCLGSSPLITNNTITGNAADSYGGGICCVGAPTTITNNIIHGNSVDAESYANGGGIFCYRSSATITNNTITGNRVGTGAYSGGGGISSTSSTGHLPPTVSNNIVAFNSSGMSCDTRTLRNNCVYGNTQYNYPSGMSVGTGDISADPWGIGQVPEDFRISLSSPCTERGWNLAPGLLSTDMDGESRIYGDTVDIGAYEARTHAAGTPVFTPDEGAFVFPVTVSISTPTAGAVVRYTTDGTVPTESDPIVTGPITLPWVCTLKARAWKEGLITSQLKTAAYTAVTAATPTMNPPGGCYSYPLAVTISCATEGAVIRYTTNGADPTINDPVAAGPVVLQGPCTVKARAWKDGCLPSNVGSAVFAPPRAATPSFDHASDPNILPVSVNISCSTPGAVIRYTTNNVDPTESDPIVTGPIVISQTTALKAVAWAPGYSPSLVHTARYAAADSIQMAKKKANGASTTINMATVAYVMNANQFCVMSDDRSCGMMISKTSHGMTAGMRAKITGTLGVGAGEKFVSATTVTQNGLGSARPVTLVNRDIGGGDWHYNFGNLAGQCGVKEYQMVRSGDTWIPTLVDAAGTNNVGLYITTFGRVTRVEPSFFYIDDGSGLRDGYNYNADYAGVRVYGTVPVQQGENPLGKYVRVSGASSCFKIGVNTFRAVRPIEIVVLQ